MYSYIINAYTKNNVKYNIYHSNNNKYTIKYMTNIYDIKEELIIFEKIIVCDDKEVYRYKYSFEELCEKFNIN